MRDVTGARFGEVEFYFDDNTGLMSSQVMLNCNKKLNCMFETEPRQCLAAETHHRTDNSHQVTLHTSFSHIQIYALQKLMILYQQNMTDFPLLFLTKTNRQWLALMTIYSGVVKTIRYNAGKLFFREMPVTAVSA